MRFDSRLKTITGSTPSGFLWEANMEQIARYRLYHVAKDDSEFLILLPQAPRCWDDRRVQIVLFLKGLAGGGWRGGLAVRCAGCSSGGPGFSSQPLHAGLRLSVTPVAGEPTSSLAFTSTGDASGTQIYTQAECPHIQNRVSHQKKSSLGAICQDGA